VFFRKSTKFRLEQIPFESRTGILSYIDCNDNVAHLQNEGHLAAPGGNCCTVMCVYMKLMCDTMFFCSRILLPERPAFEALTGRVCHHLAVLAASSVWLWVCNDVGILIA
jgi:hypothetical protein